MRRFPLFYVVPSLLMLLIAVSSLIGGSQTLYHRDILVSHFPLKAAHAQVMDDGAFLPLVDPHRSGGQPLMGNPNAVPFYPTNLLYRVASPLWALNAHFWLHWMLAPFAMFWLGRAWGLSRPAAWAAGVVYAGSGYFLSQLNLYNLVGGAVWVPAFVAACLGAARARSPWPSVSLSLCWAFLILSGDPMTALLGLFLGASTWLARRPACLTPAAFSAVGSLAVGTLLAAPMWVELFRILPLSYRGYWRYSLGTSLAQSWNPWTAIEWIVPFFFGNLDYNFWGYSFFGGNPPLFYSLFPGVLAVALVFAAGRPRAGRGAWCWAWIVGGAFIAAGFYNPVMHAFYKLPGASALRYPIKCWILVAVAASVLAGVGFERFLNGDRRLTKLLAGAIGLYSVLWGLIILMPPTLADALLGLDRETFTPMLFSHQRLQWATSGFFVLGGCLCLWLVARFADRRSPFAMGALLLGLHLALQCFLLQPLFDTDDAAIYTGRPEIAEKLPVDSRVAHGTFGGLFFGPKDPSIDPQLQGVEFFWLSRKQFSSFGHFAAVPQGYRYELNQSPEGLDSFYSVAMIKAFKEMDDLSRIRLLAAVGTERLLIPRALAPSADSHVSLVHRSPGGDKDMWHYKLERVLPEIQVVGRVQRADNMNTAFATLANPELDPRETAVLPAPGPELDAPPGTAEVISESLERLEVKVHSEQGGLLTTRRAWLPIYRAFVDGEPAKAEIVNIYKMGVMVPAGEHRVVIETDRRPTYVALAAALGATLFLVPAFRRRDFAPIQVENEPESPTDGKGEHRESEASRGSGEQADTPEIESLT